MDFTLEAEALVRSLAGVAHARIDASGRAIRTVHVLATDDDAARNLARHVRSALLAGLATPVVPARIHVRVAGGADSIEGSGDDRGGSGADDRDHRDERDDRDGNGGHRPASGHGTTNGHAGRPDADAPDAAPRAHVRLAQDDADREDAEREHHDAERERHRADARGRQEPDDEPPFRPLHTRSTPARSILLEAIDPAPATVVRRAHVARPRLVAVDLDRAGDGRVVCRVSVAWNARVHRAEAVAMDLPGAAAQAAAQAAVRAMGEAGIEGLELNGLREVEIAGRDYVLVALRRTGSDVRHRSGSACIFGSPERAAAEAAVHAADELTR